MSVFYIYLSLINCLSAEVNKILDRMNEHWCWNKKKKYLISTKTRLCFIFTLRLLNSKNNKNGFPLVYPVLFEKQSKNLTSLFRFFLFFLFEINFQPFLCNTGAHGIRYGSSCPLSIFLFFVKCFFSIIRQCLMFYWDEKSDSDTNGVAEPPCHQQPAVHNDTERHWKLKVHRLFILLKNQSHSLILTIYILTKTGCMLNINILLIAILL